MGQPKALLPFGGEPLIVHSVRTLQQHFEFAKLLGAKALFRCCITLLVTNIVKFLEKWIVTYGEDLLEGTF